MAYVITETEDGTFRCENDETGATGYGETPEEALEALTAEAEEQDGDSDDECECDEACAYDAGRSEGFAEGFEAARAEIRHLFEDKSDDLLAEIENLEAGDFE